jgi:hypothetical protein
VRRFISLLAPALMAACLLASPAPVAAAGSITETGAVTYTVNTAESRIDVSLQLKVVNKKAPSGGYYYYAYQTQIAVEVEAGPVKVSSNAGAVSQTVVSSGRWYRIIELTYTKVLYGQTRTINVSYSIDAKPRAEGGYRAGEAYANLCTVGNGYNSGTINVVLPATFDVKIYSGLSLKESGTSDGLRTLTSGTLAEPRQYWSCLDGTNVDALVSTKVTVAGQVFEIQSWPEDPVWKSMIEDELEDDIPALLDMNGLDLPGGTVIVREVGNYELGEYSGMYNSLTKIAYVTEETGADVIAHELSHIWYNRDLFADKWASEGLAGYSEQLAGPGEYTRCTKPEAYPGKGKPDLSEWVTLTMTSTLVDEQVLDYQYDAACYIITTLADEMGEESFRAVLVAGSNGEIAYLGGTPGETFDSSETPLSAESFLDLIDERGMIPAGIEDLDEAQDLLAKYGIFDARDLADRSKAREAYHALADEAGDWDLPLAIRGPMASWDFDEADDAMDSASQIVEARDKMESELSDVDLDGTKMQTLFEDAEATDDLATLSDKVDQEVAAAEVLADAQAAESSGHDPLAMIGLLGTDLQSGLDKATDALKDMRSDDAKAAAQKVLDEINGATTAGLLRLAVLLGLVAGVILAFFLIRRFRAQRQLAAAMALTGEAGGVATGMAVAPDAAAAAAGAAKPKRASRAKKAEETPAEAEAAAKPKRASRAKKAEETPAEPPSA